MTPLLVAIVVVGSTIGDLCFSAGMKRQGEITNYSVRAIVHVCGDVVRNPFILAGIPITAISFFALVALLSTTPLSFAVPITSSSYILETALAKYLLGEAVDWKRWAGAALVTIGIAMLFI